jgi:phthalate 4,5-cis-dihydrodiol dehydrogenase
MSGDVRGRIRPIGVGVLGLGLAGRGAVQALSKSRLTNVVAICDLNDETTAAVAKSAGVSGYLSYEEMCADRAVEAIFIATPTHLRLPHVEIAIRANKHLLVEKPIARNAKEAAEIVNLADSSGLVVMSVNTRGRDAVVEAMAHAVREERLGRVLSLTNVMYKPWLLSPRYDYEMDPELGGGVNFRQAPHQVEIARAILRQPIKAVTATVGHADVPVEAYGNFNALLEFDGGASASLVFNGYGYFDTSELTWGIGEGGRKHDPGAGIALRKAESWKKVKYSEASPIRPPDRATSPARGLSIYGLMIISCEQGDIRPSRHGYFIYDFDSIREVRVPLKGGGMPMDLEEFYDAVRRDVPYAHDASWGARTVEACEAIWTSAREGRTVRL